ncbi:MAG: DUF3500 domain-containing protein, partial [Acidimicrobiales bacterium]
MTFLDRLVDATGQTLAGLDAGQRALAVLPFDEGERRTWAYWPTPRRGVPVAALDRGQTKAVHRLLSDILAEPAFARAMAIIALQHPEPRQPRPHRDARSGGRLRHRPPGVALPGAASLVAPRSIR